MANHSWTKLRLGSVQVTTRTPTAEELLAARDACFQTSRYSIAKLPEEVMRDRDRWQRVVRAWMKSNRCNVPSTRAEIVALVRAERAAARRAGGGGEGEEEMTTYRDLKKQFDALTEEQLDSPVLWISNHNQSAEDAARDEPATPTAPSDDAPVDSMALSIMIDPHAQPAEVTLARAYLARGQRIAELEADNKRLRALLEGTT